MNTWQKIVLLLFSIFLLIASLTSFSDNKPTPGILALGFSAVGLFFFFSGASPKHTLNTELKKRLVFWIKRVGLSILSFVILAIVVGWIWAAYVDQKAKDNVKLVDVTDVSIVRTENASQYSTDHTYKIDFTIHNKCNSVVGTVNGTIEYYTPDHHLISKQDVYDLTGGIIITPGSEMRMTKFASVEWYNTPHQEYVAMLVIKRVWLK